MTHNPYVFPASLMLTLLGGATLGALAMALLHPRSAAAGPFQALGQPAKPPSGEAEEASDPVEMLFI
jgi:hypothetical protein